MNETAERIREQVKQIESVYDDGRHAVGDLARKASARSKEALVATDEWVHENPWVALGIIAGAGMLMGLLVAQSLLRR